MENKRFNAKTTKIEMVDAIQQVCEDGLRLQRELQKLITPVKENLKEGSKEREITAQLIRNRNTFYFGYDNEWLNKQTKKELKSLFEKKIQEVQELINGKIKVMDILKNSIVENIEDSLIQQDEINKEEIKDFCQSCKGNCGNCSVMTKLFETDNRVFCKNCTKLVQYCNCSNCEIQEPENCQICKEKLSENGNCASCEVGFIFNEHCYDCNNMTGKTVLNENLCKTCDYNYNLYQLYNCDGNLISESRFQTMNKAISKILDLTNGFYTIKSGNKIERIYKSKTNIEIFKTDSDIWSKFIAIDSKNWLPRQENQYYIDKIMILWCIYQTYMNIEG